MDTNQFLVQLSAPTSQTSAVVTGEASGGLQNTRAGESRAAEFCCSGWRTQQYARQEGNYFSLKGAVNLLSTWWRL